MLKARTTLTGLVLLTAILLGGGCVERKLVIRSNPPGGVVVVDNKVVGVTPMTVPFTFYGERTVEVRWDPFLEDVHPFRTAKETRYVFPPLYQVFPLDLFFELVVPFTLTDEHRFHFDLENAAPDQSERSEQNVIERARALRARALADDEEGR